MSVRLAGAGFVLAVAVAAATPALAQPRSYGADRGTCDRSAMQEIFSTSRGNLIGSAAGGAIGGLIGNQFGSGGGRTLLTVAGVVGGALAGGYIGRSMDPADQGCVSRALEHSRTGHTVAWNNPDSRTQYRVTPTGNFRGPGGQPCRHFVTEAMMSGHQQQVEGIACRASDGTWRTVDAAAPPAEDPGDTVLQAQQRLQDLGFYARDKVDGIFGPKTAAAVRSFQRSRGMRATGQLDEQTLSALGVGAQLAASTAAPVWAPTADGPLAGSGAGSSQPR
jgi:surface antigen